MFGRCAGCGTGIDQDERTDGLCADCAGDDAAESTTAKEFEDALVDVFAALDGSDDEPAIFAGCRVATFADWMILTRDKGLVIRLEDGSEFQVTIVKSK